MNKNDWTRTQRYQSYDQWSPKYKNDLKQQVATSAWRLGYHVQPVTGLLNDPNGFSYYDGKWQLFYQAYPFGPVHGLKSWYHVTSDNLIDWQNEGLKLMPTGDYDSHGVYSGSALPYKDRLFLAYTGNVRNQDWHRHSYQLGAFMDQNGTIEKISEPLLAKPPVGYTEEFRDPQIISYQDGYLMVIGAQDKSEVGQVLTYFSEDLLHWDLCGELHFTNEKLGFMVECPNLLLFDQGALLLFCPQGMDPAICNYQNIYPNTYVTAAGYSLKDNALRQPSAIKNLDEGFDVYATQGFMAPDGRCLTISWVGLPEIDYPTDNEGWAHCLSQVKECVIKDGHLYQNPVAEMKALRQGAGIPLSSSHKEFTTDKNQYEVLLEFEAGSTGEVHLFADEENSGFSLSFDSLRGKIQLDRGQTGIRFAEEYGTTRSFSIEPGAVNLRIFVDHSLVEIFINDGAQTATARVFPLEGQKKCQITCEQNFTGNYWPLRDMTTNKG
ncbi:sucrose-6-phosphate hydrolase [Enterococcus sp. 2201sp1_2201st1_B8_2201SCRN_220225]|uniref:sucrose-6-phosphate hydrolase n=1 Tax=unclassified Enterococcus TaxID=2608891 RepID=UPI0034A54AAB